MSIHLRALTDGDEEPLLAWQHARAGAAPKWSLVELSTQLRDRARGDGKNVVVAERGGVVLGCGAWVEALPWMFGAPFVVGDHQAAELIAHHLVAHARKIGAKHLRVSAGDGEVEKRAALERAGLAPAF